MSTQKDIIGAMKQQTSGPSRRALIASSARIIRELGWKPALQDLRAIVASAWEPLRRSSLED